MTVTYTPQLTVSCPANKSVASSNGSPVAVTYSATTSGGVAPVTVNASPVSGSMFAVGTTPVSVTARSSDGQTASCTFFVTVTYTAPAQLTVSCPANMSVVSSNGSPVVVTYSPTASGGVAPVTVSASPVSGSIFAVGTTPVSVTARSSDGQAVACGFAVTVTYTAPPPPPPRVGGWPSVDDHVSGWRRRHLARHSHPGRRQHLSGEYHVLSESRHPFADQLDQAEDRATPLSASTARSSTAPAGRRPTTRRPRSGRTTKTSTT